MGTPYRVGKRGDQRTQQRDERDDDGRRSRRTTRSQCDEEDDSAESCQDRPELRSTDRQNEQRNDRLGITIETEKEKCE